MAFVLAVAATSLTSVRGHHCFDSKTSRSHHWKSSLLLRSSSFVHQRPKVPNAYEKPRSVHVVVNMALDKVVVAGGTGFIGSRLVRALVADGAAVTVLTRSISSGAHLPREVTLQQWEPEKSGGEAALADILRGSDLVVNLCGAPVVSRWSSTGKAAILSSRVKPTSLLAQTVLALPESERPACFVSTSAVGMYGSWPAECAAVDEASPTGSANDFLVGVCKQWEEAAAPVATATRLVVLRLGVVLAPGGGAMARMLPVFQLGAGGRVGSGAQMVSWVHADDIVKMIISAAECKDISGVYNATAPAPVTMADMSTSLARALRRPCLFPVPGFVLRAAFGGGAQVVLEGQRVLPKRWLSQGYDFAFSTIDEALNSVAKEASS